MLAQKIYARTQSLVGLVVLGLCSVLQGCSTSTAVGGQTGGEVNEPLCVEAVEVVSWSARPLGFSAAEAALALQFGETLTVSPNWLPPADSYRVTYVTPIATTTLSFVSEVVTNEARLVHSRLRTDGSGAQTAVGLADDPCRDRLELQIHVSMTTSAGELHETFDATLRVFTLEEAVLDKTLDATALSGNLNPTAADLSVEKLDLSLRLQFSSARKLLEGSLTLDASSVDGANASYTSSTVATW